ncbi:esterase family protein [Ornithinibacillus sp. L9]|uniref:Esterase family protein n=1 Tax=Ornithinibacillus caprae TaxID=2678566 RepID=A0A6N8FPU6_9BACI|nr:alpha/beta hydrolase family protein [Ornithinibacillus caprae]MUK90207.1 esterase family protein [Ornithinibacillus caprae]
MALLKCDYFSEVLGLSTSMSVILPEISLPKGTEKHTYPTLFLLHGLGDDHTIWTRRTSIERYVERLGLAVVMPQVDHSYYTDMEYGKKYWAFLSEELPHVARSYFPLSKKRNENFVAGLSMGGYGALKWALRQPEKFAAAASLSGVVDIATRVDNIDGKRKPLFNSIFGGNDIKGTEDDLYWLIEQGNNSDKPKPLLYQCCGTEDFLYEENVQFHEVVKHSSYQLQTEFGAGDHEWAYWDKKIQDVLHWLPIHQ